MKAFPLIVGLISIFAHSCLSQKYENVWLLGGGYNGQDSIYKSCRMDFMGDTFSITYIDKNVPYCLSNVSICDEDGMLQCYSNGKHVFNRNYTIMDGGSNFQPGAPEEGVSEVQSYSLIPFPGHANKIVFIDGFGEILYPDTGPTIGYTT